MLLELSYALGAVLLISSLSLLGVFTFSLRADWLKKALLYLVSFSAGALFGDALLHLIPEAAAATGFTSTIGLYVILGIGTSFFVEKIIQWRHCHIEVSEAQPHPFAYMNLIGDSIHNLIDGVIIGASFLASIPLGIATTFAVILHEVPQEFGDFAVLIHGGFTRKKALFFNFATALTAFVGVGVAFSLSRIIEAGIAPLLAFSAGAFLYIAGSDLLPELHRNPNLTKTLLEFVAFLFGIGVMYWLLIVG